MGKTVSNPVPTLTDLAGDVRDFLGAHPGAAEHLPAIRALISKVFQEPELEFAVIRPSADEDATPLLAIFVHHRELASEARNKRRMLLNGPWLMLPAAVVSLVSLHLGHRVESR